MPHARPGLVPPEVMLTVDPARAHALLSALRAPAALVRASADATALSRLLFVTPLGLALSKALHQVVALASTRGQWALLEAALDVGGVDASSWDRMRSLDLAASVVTMAARGDVAAERCIERALVRLARLLSDRMGYELVPRAPPAPIAEPSLSAALLATPDVEGEPWVVADDDGTLHAALRWRGAGDFEGKVLVDLVAIEAGTGRLTIETARPDRIFIVARALAQPVFGDAHPFLERPAFTLRPVLDGLPRALPPSVKSVTVVGCQLVSEGQRFEARSDDALSAVADLFPSRGGYVGRATLRFVLEGSVAPVDVYVELPNRIGLRDARFRREVRAGLRALGVLSPGASGDDIATLAHAPSPDWRWREVAGAEGLGRMKALGLLVPADPSATRGIASESGRPWSFSMRLFALHHPLDRGRFYALAEDAAVRARTVGDEDRRMLRLDLEALARTLRDDLGLVPASPSELPAGVIDLGVAAGDEASFRVFYVTALPSELERRKLVRVLAKAALPAHAVLLVPRGRRLDHPLEVEIDAAEQLGLASARPKLAAVLASIRGAESATRGLRPRASRSARTDVRLVITGAREHRGTVVQVNGASIAVTDKAFALLVYLVAAHVTANGTWKDRRSLGIHLTPHVPSRLRTALKGALPKGFELVESDAARHRLSPEVVVDEVDWEALADHPDERVRKLATARGRR